MIPVRVRNYVEKREPLSRVGVIEDRASPSMYQYRRLHGQCVDWQLTGAGDVTARRKTRTGLWRSSLRAQVGKALPLADMAVKAVT